MALWWRSHQEVQRAIESFGADIQEDPEKKDLQQRESELAARLKEHHPWLLHTLNSFRPPSAASKAALEKDSVTLGQQSIAVKAEWRAVALEASARLDLDEVQAYLLVHRCAEEGQDLRGLAPAKETLVEQVVAYYGAERLALLTSLRTLLSFQDGDNVQAASPAVVFTDVVTCLIEEGLEANLVGLMKSHLTAKPPPSLESSFVVSWADQMAAEQSLLMSTLFMRYFSHPPTSADRISDLAQLFTGDVFVHDESAADTWQSYTTSDLSGVRHLAVLLLLVMMGLDRLPPPPEDDVSTRPLAGYPFDSPSAVAQFDALILSLSDASPHSAPLSLAWASSLQLLRAVPTSGGLDLLANLPPEGAEYHIQGAEEGGAFEQMLAMLGKEEFCVSEPQVTAYKFMLKLVVATSLRAYNLTPAVVDESNPRGQIVINLLTALFSGEEYLALNFFDSALDAPIKELAEALALFWPARSRRFLALLTSLCQGPWAAENVFNFLYHQRTVTFPHPSEGDSTQARLPIPLPLASGLFVPSDAQGAFLGVDDLVNASDKRAPLVAWECRHHPMLLLLLVARSLAERLARGVEGDVGQLGSILSLLSALVSAGGPPVASLMLDLDSSPLVTAGKRDGRVDPALQLDTVATMAAICHHVGYSGEARASLLAPIVGVLASFVETCPARVAANLAHVGLFEVGVEGGKLEQLQEVLEGGEYRTGEAKLTLAVLELVHQLVQRGVQSPWAAAVVRHCIGDLLPQVKGRSFRSQVLLWQVVGRALDIAGAALSSSTLPQGNESPVLSAATNVLLDSPSPDARNILLSALAVGAKGLEDIELSPRSEVGELEAAQDTIAGALRLFKMLLEHKRGKPTTNAFEAVVFKEGNEALTGAIITFFRYSSSTSMQAAAAEALQALMVRVSVIGGNGIELATGIVRAVGEEEASWVQEAIGEALEVGESGSPGRAFEAIADLLAAGGEWQPSFVAWVFLPPRGKRIREGIGAGKQENGMSKEGQKMALQSLRGLVKKLSELITGQPKQACHILAMLFSLVRSCGSEALESALGREGVWSTLSQVLQNAFESLRSSQKSNDNAHIRLAYVKQGIAIVLATMAEQMWNIRKRRNSKPSSNGGAIELAHEALKSEALEVASHWQKSVGEGPRETVEHLGRDLLPVEGLRDVLVLSRAAVVGMLGSPPPRPDASFGEALEEACGALEGHPAFNQLAHDKVYSSTNAPATFILTDLAAHLSGLLSGRPIPIGPFHDLAAYTEELVLEALLMRRYDRGLHGDNIMITSSAEMLTSSFGRGPFNVAGAARAVGPDAGEAVREALGALARWNEHEQQAKAHLHMGRSFALMLGMAATLKTSEDLWPPSELSASITTVCTALDSAASSPPTAQPGAATSSSAATSFGRVSVLSDLLASLVHASPPQTRREIAPLVVQTAAQLLQSRNGRVSPWLGTTALKSVLQSAVVSLNPEGLSLGSNEVATGSTEQTLLEALPALCAAVTSGQEQTLVRVVLSELLFSWLPVHSWEGRVMQNLPFNDLVKSLPGASTEHLGGVLGMLQGLVQRSGEVAGRLVDAGLVQALTSLFRTHSPPSSRGPFFLPWDLTHPNLSPVWASAVALLAALTLTLTPRPSFRERLEAALVVLGPSILQALAPPSSETNGRPRMSMSSVRAALHSAQLLSGLPKPGASLTPLLGARVVHLIDRAAIQLLHFISHQGAPAKKGVSFAIESREDRALAKAEPKLSTESTTKGWYGVVAASAREQSPTKAGQLETGSQTPQLTAPQTLALTSATPSATAHQNGHQSGISEANGASLMRAGASSYTEGLASDVYRLGEALARYVTLRVGEAMDQIQRHVTGGAPPPELPTSETLHALQDQCLLLVPILAPFPDHRDPVIALLDHAFLLEAATNQLFGARPAKMRGEIAAKHVKTAIAALRQQGAQASKVLLATRSAASQMYPQIVGRL